MSEAMRDNKGKPKMSYFMRSFPRMVQAIARVKEMGGIKYEEGNWKSGNKPDEEYWDSMSRHLDYIFGGEIYDQDTGCLHIAHAVWNMCALLELNYHDLPVIDETLFAERAIHWGRVRAEREQAEKDAKFGEALSSLFINDKKIADVVEWEAVLTVDGFDTEITMNSDDFRVPAGNCEGYCPDCKCPEQCAEPTDESPGDCDDTTGCLGNCADCDVDCPDNVEADSEPTSTDALASIPEAYGLNGSSEGYCPDYKCPDTISCQSHCGLDCEVVDCDKAHVEANSEDTKNLAASVYDHIDPDPADALDAVLFSAVSAELWSKYILDSAKEVLAFYKDVPPETSRHVSIPKPMDFTFTYEDAVNLPDYPAIEKRLNAPPLPQEQDDKPKDIVFTIKDAEKLPSFIALEKRLHAQLLQAEEQEARTQEEADKILHSSWKEMAKTLQAEAKLNDAILALGAERAAERVAQKAVDANRTSPLPKDTLKDAERPSYVLDRTLSPKCYLTHCTWPLDQAEWSRCDTTDFPG